MNLDEYFAEVIAGAVGVDVPDDIRVKHQVDRTRLEERSQCVCTCGACCASYAGHLVEAAEHQALWNRLCAERGHPAEAFTRAGIDPRRVEP